MKKLFIIYNSIMGNCSFGGGKNYSNRKIINYFKCDELINQLKKIDTKRKTELYLKNLPKEAEESIKRLFKGTKISVKNLEKDI